MYVCRLTLKSRSLWDMEQLNMSQSAVIENKTIFQGLAPNLFGFKKKKKKKNLFFKVYLEFSTSLGTLGFFKL